MSGFGGKTDMPAQALERPQIAKSGHSSSPERFHYLPVCLVGRQADIADHVGTNFEKPLQIPPVLPSPDPFCERRVNFFP